MINLDQLASSFDSGYLNLFLFPTEKCNFRCTYCYEDFAIGRMRPDVVTAVKSLISKRWTDIHTLEVSWFGGEPLLARSIIEEISLHILGLADRKSVRYKSNVTTNGYLLDFDTAKTLRRLGITFYQVSLDGPPNIHNQSRLKADGAGTFADIWTNLKAIRDSSLDITVMLRVHFSPDTYEATADLIELINREFGEDPRFTVFFKAVERLGGSKDSELRLFEPEEKKRVISRFAGMLRRPSQLHELVDNCGTYICYACKPNSFAIRANGNVSKCTVGLYDDRNHVGKLLPNGDILLDQAKMRWWMRGFSSLKADELTCPNGAAPVEPEQRKVEVVARA